MTDANGVATAPDLTANIIAGSYAVTASVAGLAATASFNLTNNAGSPASVSTTAGGSQRTTINAAFGTNLQATVKDANGNPVMGAGVTFTAFASVAGALFSGSTTTTVTTNSTGIAIASTLTANSVAGNFTVTATVSGVAAPANFSLTNSPGPAAIITATSGTPQGATINSAFATALKATVKDASGNLVNGVNVTFAAPSSGASGVFGGPTTVITNFATALKATVKDAGGNPLNGVSVTFAAPTSGAGGVFGGSTTVTTNSSGIATAPTLTANSIAGNFTVTANVSGVASPAGFSLTNNPGPLANITPTAGTPQSAPINTVFAVAFRALVKDAGGNPLGGVSVTFGAPSSGASGSFSGSPSVTTDGTGVAVAPAFTANAQTGSYVVTASALGLTVPASFNLTNSASTTTNGALSGSGTSLITNADLTAEGHADWVHWGDGSLTRKAGVTAQISDATMLGTGPLYYYSNDPRPLSWTDGTPTASGTNHNGIYVGISAPDFRSPLQPTPPTGLSSCTLADG